MELTGQCKEAFEKWFIDKELQLYIIEDLHCAMVDFYKMYPSMQYGVYVDFFDSVGIYIDVVVIVCGFELSIWKRNIEKDVYCVSRLVDSKTRHEARAKAIETANEIYNEQSETAQT